MMASMTVRDIPDDAKLRFRQIAAAHGRSMEEHLRQMIIEAGVDREPGFKGVNDVPHNFRHSETAPAPRAPNWIDELIRLGQGLELEIPPRKVEKLREIDFG